eukprot:CAMPEP_0119562814 /NCGR_PEP_ID=MMETSP1352-20130426/21639_1 /TAXON_ID=265584 /ORGANISM="Stauroneis constricta, Strain CCMP1120" /LENGTH=293 /DNA_ID=CAMNT_0007611303 /DNA_START=66 /DNA_END=947 /DNA_ORIENTATION=-
MAEGVVPDTIPPTSEWKNESVCLFADTDKGFRAVDFDKNQPLPLGVPIAIKNDVFDGHIMIRIRHATSNDPEQCSKYFDETRKRVTQTVIQGKFLRDDITFDQLMVGDQYDRGFRNLPPAWILGPFIAFFSKIVPGIKMDLTSDKPSVFTYVVGDSQTMRADKEGEQPDMCAYDIEEDVKLILPKEKYHTISARRKYFATPKHASKYTVDPNLVYTFNLYDNIMDYGKFEMKMGILGSLSMITAYDSLAPSLGMKLKDAGDWIFRVQILHTKLIEHWDEVEAKKKAADEKGKK